MEVSQFVIKNCLNNSTETFFRATFLCLWMFLVCKNFMHKRWYHSFSSNFFCPIVSIIFVEGIFCCLWVLACAWHRLNLHVLKFYAKKQSGKNWIFPCDLKKNRKIEEKTKTLQEPAFYIIKNWLKICRKKCFVWSRSKKKNPQNLKSYSQSKEKYL